MADQERTPLPPASEAHLVAQLRFDTAQAAETYMTSLRQSGLLDAGESTQTQRQQLSGLHQVYASMMVLQCLQPLQRGIGGTNVVSVLGMGASMWVLSPNFRTQVGSLAGRVGDAIRDKIAHRGAGDPLAGSWQKRLDTIASGERGQRLPFTAQSAAMTELALAESVYADMRRPDADLSGVRDRYDSALTALYGYVDDDGLDREDVSRSMRVIVGQRLERDRSIASVFSELGHGRFTKSEPREVFINSSRERATVWTGDFIDSHEGRTVSRGSFHVRAPMNLTEHRVLAAETLSAEMTSATSVPQLNAVLSQYVQASSVGAEHAEVDRIEDPDARRRSATARTMFASMAADGLTPDQQRFAFASAYIDAVEVLQRESPELATAWAVEYGDDWRTDSATARVRRARVNQHYNEVETGGITGIGRDDAAPLQDVDFELG